MNLTLEGKEKCANEVVKRVTTAQVRFLRAEASKGKKSLNCDCLISQFVARVREDLCESRQ